MYVQQFALEDSDLEWTLLDGRKNSKPRIREMPAVGVAPYPSFQCIILLIVWDAWWLVFCFAIRYAWLRTTQIFINFRL
jgi:hypothetical protein